MTKFPRIFSIMPRGAHAAPDGGGRVQEVDTTQDIPMPGEKRGQTDAALHRDLGSILERAENGRGKGATATRRAMPRGVTRPATADSTQSARLPKATARSSRPGVYHAYLAELVMSRRMLCGSIGVVRMQVSTVSSPPNASIASRCPASRASARTARPVVISSRTPG